MNDKQSIIELVGPPGAGKTTLARFLLSRHDDMCVQPCPYFRRLRDDPFFVRSTVVSAPTILRLYRNRKDGLLTYRDVALMTILQGWHRELKRLARRGGKTIILEEGAVCGLAKLHGFGSEPIRSEYAKRWWDEVYERWAKTLDLVVLLEASVPTLLQRVRSRSQQFEIGKMTDEQAMEYLASIRVAQGQVLSALTAIPGGPQILRFNSEDCTPDQIAFLMR
jgi:hypothetical protein